MNHLSKAAEQMPLKDVSKWYGQLLIGAPILATIFAFFHPQITSHDFNVVMRELVQAATFNGWIHGTLIALYFVNLAGFSGWACRLGISRPTVVLGLVFYAVGAMAFTSAAVINGFALAMFAERIPNVRPDDITALAGSFNMAASIAAVWAAAGVAATSGAILAWSVCMIGHRTTERAIGLGGIVIAVGTLAVLISGSMVLDVHGFLLMTVAQAVWTIAVGATMVADQGAGDEPQVIDRAQPIA